VYNRKSGELGGCGDVGMMLVFFFFWGEGEGETVRAIGWD